MRSASFVALALLPAVVAVAAHRDAHPAAREVARLRAHFDSVDRELSVRDVRALGPTQRAKRTRLVAVLRAYRDRGRFPRNTDFPGRRVAYFVDRAGTACAVGYLMLADGRRDLVSRVARTDNHVLLPALAGDTAVVAWLAQAGLTLDEAARIQPTYDGGRPVPRRESIGWGLATTDVVTGAVSGLTVGLNLAAPRDSRGRAGRVTLGVAAGIASLLAGLATAADQGSGALAVTTAAIGVTSIGTAVWSGLRPRTPHPAAGAAPSPPGASRDDVALGLAVAPARRPALAVRVAF